MKQFIKYLQECKSGSNRLISEDDLEELCSWLERKGWYIVSEGNSFSLSREAGEHRIQRDMTERDAVRLFKMIRPETFSRKTPFELRFENRKRNKQNKWN